MIKKIISVLFVFFTFYLNAEEAITERPVLHEMTFEISIKNLIVDSSGLSVVYEGRSFAINALQRKGDHWMATVVYGKDAGYCQRGHDLCYMCRLCHREGCQYYVVPCWKR